MKKYIIYYTDNHIDESLRIAVAKQLVRAAGGIPIISVSQKPIELGLNILIEKIPRCDSSIFKQIVIGTDASDADIIYLAEHDVLYHPSHFEFTPGQEDMFYYNGNQWHLRASDGQASTWKRSRISGRGYIVAFRDLILEHYNSALEGRRHRVRKQRFMSAFPNIDIRHGMNFSKANAFRSRNRRNFILANEIPGWGKTKGRFKEFIEGV